LCSEFHRKIYGSTHMARQPFYSAISFMQVISRKFRPISSLHLVNFPGDAGCALRTAQAKHGMGCPPFRIAAEKAIPIQGVRCGGNPGGHIDTKWLYTAYCKPHVLRRRSERHPRGRTRKIYHDDLLFLDSHDILLYHLYYTIPAYTGWSQLYFLNTD